MKQPTAPILNTITAVLTVILSGSGSISCNSGTEPSPSPDRNTDPGRCILNELGEATDAIENPIPDDQLVALQGISDPKILVWRDEDTSRIYYVTRISGTGARLLYMAEIQLGETPTALAHFEGTIRKWQNLPADLSRPMAEAIRTQWDVVVDPSKTWLIKGNTRPDGCPKAKGSKAAAVQR